MRVVNVVDLMRLQPDSEHPHGLPDREFDSLFTADRPVVFAYHGYPWLIHRLTYRRTNHDNLHVRGYKEEGTTTTPVRHGDAQRPRPLPPRHGRHRPRARRSARRAADLRQQMVDARVAARLHTREHGEDPPEIAELDLARWQRRPTREGARRQRRLVEPEAARGRRRRHGGVVARPRRRRRATSTTPSWRPRSTTFGPVDAVGHRVVHGGTAFRSPVVVDDDVLAALDDARRPGAAPPADGARLDPHAACALLPDVADVACFDTAFHATLPAAACDLRRAGGSGATSSACAATASTGCRTRRRRGGPPSWSAATVAELRIVTCHLGAGASLAAVAGGGQRRHHDGLHPARRPGDDDPVRVPSIPALCRGS